jgi:hypothetical protein
MKSRMDIIHTSVDDARSSLALINPTDCEEIKRTVNMLGDNLLEETRMMNRTTMKNMLTRKIKQLEKKL